MTRNDFESMETVLSPNPYEQMAQMTVGYWVSQMVYVAAKLGLADRLAHGPRSADELAEETGTHSRALYRLLRGLAGLGVFSETADGRFHLNELGETLRREGPQSQWAMAVMMGEEHYRCWGDLLESVRTGETAFDRLYGRPIFNYLADHPEQAAVFDAAMTAIHGRETKAMLDAYDLSGVRVLADVGGGNGTNLVGVLKRHPTMKGVLFDLPHVVERAKETLESGGVSARCEVVSGDFFADISVQADVYFLRHIIHDWDDERAARILRNVRAEMPAGAKLLLVEYVLPPGDAPSFGKLLDLNMLLLPGGVERTEEEFRRLLDASGFRLTQVVETVGGLSVVEAVPKAADS